MYIFSGLNIILLCKLAIMPPKNLKCGKRGKNEENLEILLSALLTIKTNSSQTTTPYTYIL